MIFLLLVSVVFFGGGGGGGGRKPWIVVVAQLQPAATYIDDSHTVQMYNYSRDSYSSKGPTENCKAIWAKIAGSRNIQHRKRGGY